MVPNDGLKLLSRGYAENMAHAVMLAVDQPEVSAGEIYNVRDERLLSLREWITYITRAMNHELEMVSLPFELARPSRPYAERAHHDAVDIAKVMTELGYRDVVPVEEALGRTVAWYLENRPEPGGEAERQLRDAFDYATEDNLIHDYQRFLLQAREQAAVGYHYRHSYAHPKSPMQQQ